MAETPQDAIQIVAYDPFWPQLYLAEATLVQQVAEPQFLEIEHVGSTAVPGLAAKPVIDMMASVADLRTAAVAIEPLSELGYHLIETGMPDRLFLRKHMPGQPHSFHLHIVEASRWPERNERLLRDYLRAHPEAAQAYGDLKQRLARAYARDSFGYTKAKTAFIQSVMDQARDQLGLPRVQVWEE